MARGFSAPAPMFGDGSLDYWGTSHEKWWPEDLTRHFSSTWSKKKKTRIQLKTVRLQAETRVNTKHFVAISASGYYTSYAPNGIHMTPLAMNYAHPGNPVTKDQSGASRPVVCICTNTCFKT